MQSGIRAFKWHFIIKITWHGIKICWWLCPFWPYSSNHQRATTKAGGSSMSKVYEVERSRFFIAWWWVCVSCLGLCISLEFSSLKFSRMISLFNTSWRQAGNEGKWSDAFNNFQKLFETRWVKFLRSERSSAYSTPCQMV